MATTEALSALVEHCAANGGVVAPSVEFRVGDDGVSVFAQSSTNAGDRLISIPYSLCLSVSNVSEHPRLVSIFAENPGLLDYPDEVLAIGLMFTALYNDKLAEEQLKISSSGSDLVLGPNLEECPWSWHVQTMPTSFNTPLFWTSSELELIKGHNIYHLTPMLRRQLQLDFSSIHEPLSQQFPEVLGGLTLSQYMWAMSIVYSRAIELNRNDRVERVIVPLVDLVNHHPYLGLDPSDASVFTALSLRSGPISSTSTFAYTSETSASASAADDCFHLLSGRAYQPDEQVFAVYGDYSNAKLVYSYGFALYRSSSTSLDLNPFRGVDVYLKCTPQTSESARKQALLSQIPKLAQFGSVYDFAGTVRSGGVISEAMWSYVRVLQAQGDELRLLEERLRLCRTSTQNLGALGLDTVAGLLSPRNELSVVQSLKSLCLLRARVDKAEQEMHRLGELLLQVHSDRSEEDEGVSEEVRVSRERELLALLLLREDREVLLEAARALESKEAQLLQRDA